MAKVYEHETKIKYFGVIYVTPSGEKLFTVNASADAETLKRYWEATEAPSGYKYVKIAPLESAKAYEYFKYWGGQTRWKHIIRNFDFFKYVLGCDFGEEYKPE